MKGPAIPVADRRVDASSQSATAIFSAVDNRKRAPVDACGKLISSLWRKAWDALADLVLGIVLLCAYAAVLAFGAVALLRSRVRPQSAGRLANGAGMSGGGARDRRGRAAPPGCGDRSLRLVSRPVSLLDLDGALIGIARLVVDDWVPDVVMFECNPFLLQPQSAGLSYQQARPYRADAMVEDLRP